MIKYVLYIQLDLKFFHTFYILVMKYGYMILLYYNKKNLLKKKKKKVKIQNCLYPIIFKKIHISIFILKIY